MYLPYCLRGRREWHYRAQRIGVPFRVMGVQSGFLSASNAVREHVYR